MKKTALFLVAMTAIPVFVSASIDTNLKYGARGSDVTELQEFLISKGFLSGTASGNFFSLTKKAVIAYQQSVNLPATGYVGSLTRSAINQELAQGDASSTQSEIAETGTITPPTQTDQIALLLQQIKLLQQQIDAQKQAQNLQTQQNTQLQQTLNQIAQNTTPTQQSTTSIAASTTPPATPPQQTQQAPFISFTLNQASHYHFGLTNPINNTNIAYELAFVIPSSINSTTDEIKVHLGGNINDSDIALVYLDRTGINNPDYNGRNLNDVIAQRTVGYTTIVSDGVADIHFSPAYQSGTFPEIVIVFNASAIGKWTEATGVDFYYQGNKLKQSVSVINPSPASSLQTITPTPTPVTSTTTIPVSTPVATSKATTTITVWNNVAVSSDETPGGTFDVSGYKTGDLHLAWTGTSTHTCQWKASPVANNNGTFYYFADSSCNATTTISFLQNSVYISAWTPANGTLNGALTLYP